MEAMVHEDKVTFVSLIKSRQSPNRIGLTSLENLVLLGFTI